MNEKQTLLLIAGVTVLLCGAAGGGVYWAQDLIEQENIAVTDQEKQIAAARAKIAKIPAVENEVIVLRENVAEYVKILPQEAELTKFTRAAQRFAMLSGISFDRFVPLRPGGKGSFERISYQYSFDATLWQFLKFMSFFETYERFVRVRDFSLASGATKANVEDAVHKVRLTVETYLYNPKSNGKGTMIPNYEAKLKQLRHEIAAAGSLDLGEPYEFRGREGRRDIFVDPRQSKEGSKITPLNDQRRMIEEFSKLISSLKEKWEHSLSPEITMFERIELQRTVSNGLDEFESKASYVTQNKLIKNPALNARWYKEIQLPYKNLVAKVKKQEIDRNRFLPKEGMEALIKSMREKLLDGELEAAVTVYTQTANKIDVPKGHPLYPLRLKVEGLMVRAKVALEFSAIPLKVTGVLVRGDSKSGVILNGEVYEEGEYINETLFVKAVREDEVEFVYKGFSLVKTW
ncbi:MAG: type 4a pilus biogenesis protein PilO [Planctomycetes bacterium]|nr:type 4a pilus biogenesis protein PilO [Planctomycetota bacterium]